MPPTRAPYTPYIEGIERFKQLPLAVRLTLAIIVFGAIVSIGLIFYKHTHAFSGGSGTWDDPYVVTTCAQLEDIGTTFDTMRANYVLGNNIDCSGTPNFEPIGFAAQTGGGQPPMEFNGRFDGTGHTISNVNIDPTSSFTDQDYPGLFSRIWGGSVVNLTLSNITLNDLSTNPNLTEHVGLLAGDTYEANIVGVTITGSNIHTLDKEYVGGIAGDASYSNFYDDSIASSNINVTGSAYIGGFVGHSDHSVYANSFSTASTTFLSDETSPANFFSGGIIGQANADSIANSYASTTMSGDAQTGGLIGEVFDTSDFRNPPFTPQSTITSSYFSGTINITSYNAGGLVGLIATENTMPISNSFSVGHIAAGGSETGAIIGGAANIQPALAEELSNNFYSPTATGLTQCSGNGTDASLYTSTQCKSRDPASSYNVNTNTPLTSWDFTNRWQTNASVPPSLRTIPYTPPSSAVSINSCSTLASAIKANPNGWYQLSQNIDCAGNTNLIPFSTSTDSVFTGILDGNGHTLNGVSLTDSDAGGAFFGLFDRMYGAIIENITFAGSGINAANIFSVGGIAGTGGGLVFSNTHSTVPVNGGPDGTGGLVGYGGSVIVDNSSVNANILSSTDNFGGGTSGFAGYATWMDIENSSYEGSLTGDYNVGGFGGDIDTSYVNNSHATTTIAGGFDAGGFFGFDGLVLASSTISNSSADVTFVDSVTETDPTDLGGFVGDDGGGGNFDSPGGNTGDNLSDVEANVAVNFTDPATTGAFEIGGLEGEYSGGNIENATTTFVVNAPGSSDGWEYFGSIIGELSGPDQELNEYSNISTVSTLDLGTTLDPDEGQVEAIGGVVGGSDTAQLPMQLNNVASNATINIVTDASSTSIDSVGGLVGLDRSPAISDIIGPPETVEDSNNVAIGSITIIGNDVEEVGGAYGSGGELNVSDSYASTTMSISAPSADDIGGFIGEDGSGGTVARSFSNGSLTINTGQDDAGTAEDIGGFVGDTARDFINNFSVENVLVNSTLSTGDAGDFIGGFAGEIDSEVLDTDSTTSVTNSYSEGLLTLGNPGGTAYFTGVGGFIGTSTDPSNIITDDFAVSPVAVPAGSVEIGGFLGSYTGGEKLSDDAYDSVLTGQATCTGQDEVDPSWCSDHTTASYFYSSSNAPMSSWDFTSIWQAECTNYPLLQEFASLFGGGGSCGGGSTPPTVTTTTASSITNSGATLNGNLAVVGSASVTVEGFNYGLTTSYGSSVSNTSGSFSVGTFNKNVSGLTCNTAYHFEAFATSIDGTADGSDQTFTTNSCPVSGGSASSTPPTSGVSGQSATPPTPPAQVPPPVIQPTAPLGPTTPPGGTSGNGGNKPTPPTAPVTTPVVPTPAPTVTPPTPPAPITPPSPVSSTPPIDPLAIFEFVFHATANTLNSVPGKAVAATGIALTALGSLMTFLPDIETFGDVPGLVARGAGTFFAFGFLRKPRNETWGVVYDSATRRPLDPAVVTLYDAQGNQLKTAITDMDGRFAFLVEAGTYSLTAEKGAHAFPAKSLPVDEPVYINRYTGGPIVMDQAGVLIRDIPLDPTSFDWNEEEKFKHGLFRFYSRFDRPLAYLSYAFSICGAVAAIVSVVVDPSPVNIALMIVYVVIAVLYLAGLGPRLFGVLKNADGTPLAYALVKANKPGSTGSGPHTITDRYGRYYLLTPPGKGFNVSVEELQPDHTTYKPVWQGYVKTHNGYLNKVIKVS